MSSLFEKAIEANDWEALDILLKNGQNVDELLTKEVPRPTFGFGACVVSPAKSLTKGAPGHTFSFGACVGSPAKPLTKEAPGYPFSFGACVVSPAKPLTKEAPGHTFSFGACVGSPAKPLTKEAPGHTFSFGACVGSPAKPLTKEAPGHTFSFGACVGSPAKPLTKEAPRPAVFWLPLDYSCYEGYAETVKVLLEHGADPRPADEKGPIYHAIDQGRRDILKLLLQKIEVDCPDFKIEDFLQTAITKILYGNITFSKSDPTDTRTQNILQTAITQKRKDILKILVDLMDTTALHTLKVEHLLNTAIVKNNNIIDKDVLKILFERIDINLLACNGENFLFKVINKESFECFKILIEIGKANVNCKDNNDQNALHQAVLKNQMEMVQYLFAYTDINVDDIDKNGKTAIQLSKTIEMTKLLNMLNKIYKNQAIPKKENKAAKLNAIEKDIECSQNELLKIDKEIEKIDTQMIQLNKKREHKLTVEKTAIENELNEKIAKKENYLQEPAAKKSKLEDGADEKNWNECPICSEVMASPKTVYQCAEGHCFCSDCRPSLTLCAICRMDITGLNIRSRAMEKLIENGGTM